MFKWSLGKKKSEPKDDKLNHSKWFCLIQMITQNKKSGSNKGSETLGKEIQGAPHFFMEHTCETHDLGRHTRRGTDSCLGQQSDVLLALHRDTAQSSTHAYNAYLGSPWWKVFPICTFVLYEFPDRGSPFSNIPVFHHDTMKMTSLALIIQL
jgi:hypothetical protein